MRSLRLCISIVSIAITDSHRLCISLLASEPGLPEVFFECGNASSGGSACLSFGLSIGGNGAFGMKKCVTWGRVRGFLFSLFGFSLLIVRVFSLLIVRVFPFLTMGRGFHSPSDRVFTPHRSGFHLSSIILVTPPKANPSSHLLLNAFSQTHPNEDTSQRTESMLHSSTHSIEQSASNNEIAKDDRPNRALPRLSTPNCPRFPSFPVSTIGERKKRLSTHTMDPGRSPCPYRLIDDTGGAFMIGTGDECADYA